jgi:hypothetical protein
MCILSKRKLQFQIELLFTIDPVYSSFGRGEGAMRLGSATSVRLQVAFEKCWLWGFHVRRSIERILTSPPTTPDSLSRTRCFLEEYITSVTYNTLTANMSDYGGDDEPMDYAMGECASPSRILSQEPWD